MIAFIFHPPEIINISFVFSGKMDLDVSINPWLVSSFEEFHFYCCPECDIKTKEKGQLYDHAVQVHQLAKDTLTKSLWLIKESIEDQTEFAVHFEDLNQDKDPLATVVPKRKAIDLIECADCGEYFENNVDYNNHYYAVHVKDKTQDPLATKIIQPTKRKAIEPLLEILENDLSKKKVNNVQCIDCQNVFHPSLLEKHKKVCPNQKHYNVKNPIPSASGLQKKNQTSKNNSESAIDRTEANKDFLFELFSPQYGDDKDKIGNETYFWKGKQVRGKRCINCIKNTHPADHLHKAHVKKCVKIKKQCQACFKVVSPKRDGVSSHPCYVRYKDVEFLDLIEGVTDPIEPEEELISDGQIKIEIKEELKDSPNIFIDESIQVKESLKASTTSIDEGETLAQKKPALTELYEEFYEKLARKRDMNKKYKWGGKFHPGKKCTKCLKLVHPASFASHVKQCTKPEPPELKTYFCPLCTYKTIDQVMYEAHTKCCTIVQCYVCGDLEDASRIENHLKTMHRKPSVNESMYGPKKDMFPCADCDFVACTPQDVRKHWRDDHRPKITDGSLSCDICKREFSTKDKFFGHHRQVHSKRQCEVCSFRDEIAKLRIHMKEVHPEYEPYQCKPCGLSWALEEQLQAHRQKSDTLCKKMGVNDNMEQNQEETPSNLFVCETCGKNFHKLQPLVAHKKKIHGINPTKDIGSDFVCEKCGMAFGSNYDLKAHMRKHTQSQ